MNRHVDLPAALKAAGEPTFVSASFKRRFDGTRQASGNLGLTRGTGPTGITLRPVQAGDYDLIVLPLKVRGHEGAPARAILRKR